MDLIWFGELVRQWMKIIESDSVLFFPRNVGLGSMAAFDQAGASIAPFVVLLVRDWSIYVVSGLVFGLDFGLVFVQRPWNRKTADRSRHVAHTKSGKFKNAAIFLRIGLRSIPIGHYHWAFRNIFKRWRPDNHVISLPDFPWTQNPKWQVIIAFFNSSGAG